MDLLNASFRIGRLLGINVRVHILFILFAAYRLWQGRDDLAFSAGFLGMLFGIVLVHEFGHCLGARAVGGWAENILMWPLGGLAFAHAPMTPWAQFVTVASGPLVNVVFCLVSGAVLVALSGTLGVLGLLPWESVDWAVLMRAEVPRWAVYVALFYAVNYFILAFNLLPVYPLDGGQLFQCALWPLVGLHRAMALACQVGLVGCIGLGVWGLSEGGGMLLFIALFGGFTCWQRLQMLRYGVVVDERIKYAPYTRYNRRRGGLLRRILGLKPKAQVSDPEAGGAAAGWGEATDGADERDALEAEVDRILKKVHDQGLGSLTYVERQTLERATRERQRRERELQGKA